MTPDNRRFDLTSTYDVVQARQHARQMAREIGFGLTDQTRIATAVSEVSQQAIIGEGKGEVLFNSLTVGAQRGLECICLVGRWREAPLTTSSDWVLGGVDRLVDEFNVEPRGGEEVAVVMRKWLPMS